jgi:hypothetical protein
MLLFSHRIRASSQAKKEDGQQDKRAECQEPLSASNQNEPIISRGGIKKMVRRLVPWNADILLDHVLDEQQMPR